jgi:dipeptidyl aminopeptidase/acylaminoacyl peptidase
VSPSGADSPDPSDWFQPPEWRSPTLSPDAEWIAALTDGSAGSELWVLPTQDPARSRRVATPAKELRAVDAVWSGPDQLVVLALDSAGAGGFWIAGIEDGSVRPLPTPRGARFVRLLHSPSRAPGIVCLEGIAPGHRPRGPQGRWLDLLRVDTATGQILSRTENPGDVVQWTVDAAGTPRLALAVRGDQQELRVANPPSSRKAWRTAATFDVVRDSVAVAGMAATGGEAWITARLGRDTLGVHAFDVDRGAFTRTLVSDERFDVEGRLLISDNGPVSQSWQRLRTSTLWLDPRWTAAGQHLAADDSVAVAPVDVSADGRCAVVEMIRDSQPPRFAVVFRDEPGRVGWFPVRRSSEPPRGVAQTPVEIIARDGQVLTAYLTRPPYAGPGPLVVLAHGGPWSRDVWGWQSEVQWFASRGWTVLQVNYRGSSGFGRAFQEMPDGNWQDLPVADLLEGARWAIRQGLADPAATAVAGSSFGGSLTLPALARSDTAFRAGVSLEGAFDLQSWLRTSCRHAPFYLCAIERWRLGGSPGLTSWNPRPQLADLQFPLLLLHAEDDTVVPISQSIGLAASALDLASPVTLRRIPKGGHTLGSPQQQAATWGAAEKFLIQTLGMRRFEPQRHRDTEE